MKTSIEDMKLKQILNNEVSDKCSQQNELLKKDKVKNYENNTSFINRAITAFKKTFILFCILFTKSNIKKGDDKYLLLSTPNEIEANVPLNVIFQKAAVIEALLSNFEYKYTTPFLLHSLGYKYEEIASALQLPTGIVKSRIFYLQKRMQSLLINMKYC